METDRKQQDHSQNPGWLERNGKLIVIALIVLCVGSLLAEFVVNQSSKPFFDEDHPPHFDIEKLFGYQAAIGFVAFVCVVFLGKFLRLIVKRPEDYYDQ